ncbi:MAG: GH3 auxin-responsive promoter family protein [Candidatus Bathyarchaeota archaeon]|nr:GH3 auxin-responsive promoter family protein [Candidatus Bathyarchaeota archaeon]
MGKPKTFLLPKSGLWASIQKSGMTFMFLCTHDGENITYEIGDTVYENMPGGQFISAFYHDVINERVDTGWVTQVPDVNIAFQDKIEYFIEHHNEINVAYMTVTSLIDQVHPKLKEAINLKGFITQDRSAYVLKDKIKEITGSYPKTIFGATETMFGTLPSIEYPGCFFFDWRVIYTEFIPEEHAIHNDRVTSIATDPIVPMTEVEVGQVYQLIATPFGNDLIRYVMPDLLECIAKEDKILDTSIPVFKYYSRCDNLLVLQNFTRINEDELIDVLNSVGVEYIDFVANRELDGSREYLKLYIELREETDKTELLSKIHEQLIHYDKDWRDLCSMLEYEPLKIQVLPRGAFKQYLQRKSGVPKISRINMKENNLKLLLDQT